MIGGPCCEGATTCAECGRTWCRAEDPSPREDQGICADCSTMLAELGWGRR